MKLSLWFVVGGFALASSSMFAQTEDVLVLPPMVVHPSTPTTSFPDFTYVPQVPDTYVPTTYQPQAPGGGTGGGGGGPLLHPNGYTVPLGTTLSTSLVDALKSSHLNEAERAYLKTLDPITVMKILVDMFGAKSASERYYSGDTLQDGRGDAFRHALWNFMMVRDVGVDIAAKVATVHETGDTSGWQNNLRQAMDGMNNNTGRNLAINNPNVLNGPDMINLVQSAVNSGQLMAIQYVNNSDRYIANGTVPAGAQLKPSNLVNP